MSLSTRIAPHLPYLRRFSRAVTGSQTSGDAYVAATLEALIADPVQNRPGDVHKAGAGGFDGEGGLRLIHFWCLPFVSVLHLKSRSP